MKSVLDLSNEDALKYFLQTENYCNIPLPKYFDFSKIMSFVRNKINQKDFSNCIESKKSLPANFENVGYQLLMNKGGQYSYRPLQLVNPYLYYFLSRELTSKDNWDQIKNRFTQFRNEHIEVVSIPKVKGIKDKSNKSASIKSWWEQIEQRSIALALEFKYIFITDITNCYGSIYTHSIAWAITGLDYAKTHRSENNLGNQIDKYIRHMQYGQTNGIPQGSSLFDFIAEIILGYADLLLTEKLKSRNITDYKILRFRDDYRIFSNNKDIVEVIALELQNVLSVLNLHINESKTKLSEDVILQAIKKDKLEYIYNIPIYQHKKSVFNTLQQELLYILVFSRKCPNSGTLCKLLNSFIDRVAKRKRISEDITVLSSILVEITINSPKTYSNAISAISQLIHKLPKQSEKEVLIRRIANKLTMLPNVGHLQIWMQRVSLGMKTDITYTEPLCRIIAKDPNISLWNNSWLKNNLIKEFPLLSIGSELLINSQKPTIELDEISIFDY